MQPFPNTPRWSRPADTRMRLAHFAHHRPHAGARKGRLADKADRPAAAPPRGTRGGGAHAATHGVDHRNPVARAVSKVGLRSTGCPCA